jgi:hypothetical protein
MTGEQLYTRPLFLACPRKLSGLGSGSQIGIVARGIASSMNAAGTALVASDHVDLRSRA